MRGLFDVAASPHFCSLGFLTVAFLPSSLLSGSYTATATAGPFGIRLFHGGSLRACRRSVSLPSTSFPPSSSHSLSLSLAKRNDLLSPFLDEPLVLSSVSSFPPLPCFGTLRTA